MATPRSMVTGVYKKGDDNNLSGPFEIGASSFNIYHKSHPLSQYLDHYTQFFNNATFVYEGNIRPINNQIGIWIDTNDSNAEQIGYVAPSTTE